jgi:sugar/nucleoside kinase (ribokinase family)
MFFSKKHVERNLDFLAIGDIVADSFITVSDIRIDTDADTGDAGFKEICFRFGDKIEYDTVDILYGVGNSPNAAVSAHRLGLNTGLYTELGDDQIGKDTLTTLKQQGVSTRYVHVNEGSKSNHHYVLRHKSERTILVRHEKYDYNLPSFENPPRWIYLSSVGITSQSLHHEIAEFIKKSGSKLAFQPGTFQMKLGYEALQDIYKITEVFFCNKEEAERILSLPPTDIPSLISHIHARGPKIVAITDGANGAYASDGSSMWYIPIYPDIGPPVDRTGAGDSFSSTFTAALALGLDIPTALSWGPINSMSVVQQLGAQAGLLTREKLEEYLASAPEQYIPKQIL